MKEDARELVKTINKATRALVKFQKACKHTRIAKKRWSSFEGVGTQRYCKDCGLYMGTRLEC